MIWLGRGMTIITSPALPGGKVAGITSNNVPANSGDNECLSVANDGAFGADFAQIGRGEPELHRSASGYPGRPFPKANIATFGRECESYYIIAK
jgi:hypothetical protein